MTPEEHKKYDSLTSLHNKFWIPCVWFSNLAVKARNDGRIRDSVLLQGILNEMNTLRSQCGRLYGYDWISIPLVYTQVVTVAVYSFFLACLIGRQFLDPTKAYPGHETDLFVPIFTFLQFFFYAGWLKVAEQLINPFGEDDDDFETNWLIDRNLQLFLMWDMEIDRKVCYKHLANNEVADSNALPLCTMSMQKEEMEFQPLEKIKENEEANHSTPLLGHISRFLSVQSPSFTRASSRMNLMSRRNENMPPSPYYAYPDGKSGSPTSINPQRFHPGFNSQNQWENEDSKLREFDAFMSTPFYERPGFYSAPQTPISSIPMIFPSRRLGRKKPPALSSIVACSLKDNSASQSPCKASDKDRSQSSLGSGPKETSAWPAEKSHIPDSLTVTVEKEEIPTSHKFKDVVPLGSPGALSSGDSGSPSFHFFPESPDPEWQANSKNSLKAYHHPWLTRDNTTTPNPDHPTSLHIDSTRTPSSNGPTFFSFTPLTSPVLERSHMNKAKAAMEPNSDDTPGVPEQDPAMVSGHAKDIGSGGTNAHLTKDQRKVASSSPNDSGISLAEGDLVGLMEVIMETNENTADEGKIDKDN
uniref:Uncharacterized protein n=1 Tax=Sphaerodactylus townsendi TaxID=933632 RepID=A0ACB8G2K8_9SAUR